MKNMGLYEEFLPEFVRMHMGEEAVNDLQEEWQRGVERIPVTASPEEQYRIAYNNWIWMAKTNFCFIRQRMGEEGVRKLEQTLLHTLIQHNKGWPLVMLNLVRLVSPGSAFKMLADQMSYELQWLTPYVVTECSPQKLVLEIDSCKILKYDDTEDVCRSCRQVYPLWVVNQYMADMSFERSGHHCTCTLRPLN